MNSQQQQLYRKRMKKNFDKRFISTPGIQLGDRVGDHSKRYFWYARSVSRAIRMTKRATAQGRLETVWYISGTNVTGCASLRLEKFTCLVPDDDVHVHDVPILNSLLGKFCNMYIDDIIVCSKSLEKHQHHITSVLEALKKAHLKINVQKSEFCQGKVVFLGRIFDGQFKTTKQESVARISCLRKPFDLHSISFFSWTGGTFQILHSRICQDDPVPYTTHPTGCSILMVQWLWIVLPIPCTGDLFGPGVDATWFWPPFWAEHRRIPLWNRCWTLPTWYGQTNISAAPGHRVSFVYPFKAPKKFHDDGKRSTRCSQGRGILPFVPRRPEVQTVHRSSCFLPFQHVGTKMKNNEVDKWTSAVWVWSVPLSGRLSERWGCIVPSLSFRASICHDTSVLHETVGRNGRSGVPQ